MNMKKSVRSLMSVAVFICMIAFLFSCGGGGDDAGSTPGKSATITLDTSATTLEANGTSSCTLTATVKDSYGDPVRHYTEVNFTTNLGHFRNGEKSYTVETQPPLDKDGFPDPSAAPTGKVEVQFITGTTSGTATVVVASNGVVQSVNITLTHTGNTGVPVGEAFSLSAAYLNISGWWVASLTDIITASVGDIIGTAVKDGTVIDFKTYNTGGFFENDQSATESGRASSTLYSAASPAPTEGFLTATAETTGDSTTRVTSIATVPYPDQHIMYAGTNGGGVYKSTNYGTTWETVSRSSENPKRGQNLIEPYVKGHRGIAIDPDNHNAVYVGTGYLGKGNVYRSLDGGNNWNSNNTEEWNGIYNTTAAVLTVVADGDASSTNYPYVWIGTEGKGALYATDGKTFQPSGSYASTPVFSGTGNGTMSDPVTSYASLTETWNATYVQTAGSATTPMADTGNTGDGTMSAVTTSTTTQTESWTVLYAASAGTVTPGAGNVGDGNVSSIVLTEPNAASETWTLTATEGGVVVESVTSHPQKVSDEGGAGSALDKGTVTGIEVTGTITAEFFTLTCVTGGTDSLFEVKRGSTVIGTATPGTEFSAAGVKFTISTAADTNLYDTANIFYFFSGVVTNIAATSITETEDFTLTCNKGGTGKTATFNVVSDKRGSLGTATAGTEFSAEGVTLTISAAGDTTPSDYAIGDYFTFTATVTAGATFSVVSDVGGAYPNATVGTAYSQNGLAFLINEGSTPFADGDTFQFTTTSAWQVTGTVSGRQTAEAETGTAYTSDGNEVGFTISAGSTAFKTGDKFTFSTTSGTGYWTVTGSVSGLQSNLALNGSGYYSDNGEVYFVITQGTVSFANGDTFTFTVTASTIGHGWTVWDIVRVPDTHGDSAVLYAGTATGVQKSTNGARTFSSTTFFTGDFVVALTLYPTATGGSSDTIYAGTLNAGVWVSTNSGTTWTQYTSGMDQGKGSKIKDILVDPSAYRLYALAVEGSGASATGDVYVHTLNANGTMAAGGWSKVNTGLSGKALYAMAADIPSGPTALFAGGEGINLYEATSGLDTGNPSWISSKTGLSNLLMARMPILFSGQCSLDVSQYRNGDTVNFIVYIQDVNGNPPISGTKFVATYTPASGTAVVKKDITYGDVYTHMGTFRDPSDPATNLPYSFKVDLTPDKGAGETDEVEIVYTPANTLPDAPGSSGSPVTNTYSY